MPLKVKNIAAGFYDGQGRFHPIRSSEDYDPSRVGELAQWEEPPSRKEREALAAQAAYIARESRKKRASAKKKATKKATKKTAKSKRAVSAKAAAKAVKKRSNPIPLDRYVPAQVKRTRSGDIKIMLPLR